jgi:hypothetical protein
MCGSSLHCRCCISVFQHLLSLEYVTLEDRASVEQAVSNFELGFDFDDAFISCQLSRM